MVAADGLPAVRNAVFALAEFHCFRIGKAAKRAAERFAIRIEPADGNVNGKHRKMVPALAVFGLVVNAAAFDLDLANVVVALKIAHVVQRVPEAELDGGE